MITEDAKKRVPVTRVAVERIESKEFLRDQNKKLVTFLMILSVGVILSVSLNMIQFFAKSEPRYFAATQDLRIFELTPLNKPTMSQGGLLNWTTRTMADTFSLDFLHWREQLTDVRPNYLPSAFDSLLRDMKRSGIMAMVNDKRLNLKTVVTQAPIISAEGILNGVATWRIEFPLMLSYESSRGVETTQNLKAEVIVQRVSTLKNVKGVQIKQVIFRNQK